MSVADSVADLNTLHALVCGENDATRRRELVLLGDRLAQRYGGSKVSEAAEVLGVSPPTIRSWIEAGALEVVPGSSPLYVRISSLAAVKRTVDVLRAGGHGRDLLTAISQRIQDLEPENDRLSLDEASIADLCRRFHVGRLSVFGSAVTEAFDPETSDVDFLVEFDDSATDLFGAYFGLKEELESLLGRSVDLAMPKSLENPYFAATVERTRRDLYAA